MATNTLQITHIECFDCVAVPAIELVVKKKKPVVVDDVVVVLVKLSPTQILQYK